ncbi:MAG: peptidoglycan DD-metalloendopeptidase family protein [Burkholderiaceae bacterium]|nr:peptidoglycan DD-metalloendopeptidase family protein [Burkholderiaceae bacterium]MCD8516784.1 peptidoglycan DD-metalloendopeptidase family protein [Burkholderiaceae bacterium]MCD8536672.1 peptidoglycan DD-metalloendopeptidase family protein [Burkholderiaceae bacterium]MCD8564387.1 peptidoglycan DD-metalloendopeptidase family protein [Burkholderiaceae bacterium]
MTKPTTLGTRAARALSVMALVTLMAGCAGSGIFAPISSLSDRGVDGTYRVQPGDTLTSISRETGVSVDRLIALNDISNPSLIRVGQRLRLSDDAVVSGGTMADSGSVATAGDSMAMQRGDVQSEPQPAAAPTRVTPAADAGKIAMVWPAKGEIIERFTPQTKGIDIAGTIGEPVVAAAGGNVVFAGDAVRGFGNLVIVDHGDGFITAYAHNEKLLVKKGDAVKKSQQIATLGQSATTSPRLHFEVRRNGTPVDPLRYLPAQ